MSIWTTPERQQLRKTVRAFAEREILPHVDEWERIGELPRELSRKAAETGLLGVGFPEEVGGEGGDAADTRDHLRGTASVRGSRRGLRLAVHLRYRRPAYGRLQRPTTHRDVRQTHPCAAS